MERVAEPVPALALTTSTPRIPTRARQRQLLLTTEKATGLTVTTELNPVHQSLVLLALDALGDLGLGEERDDGHAGVSSATDVLSGVSNVFEVIEWNGKAYTTVTLVSLGLVPWMPDKKVEDLTTSKVVTPNSLHTRQYTRSISFHPSHLSSNTGLI